MPKKKKKTHQANEETNLLALELEALVDLIDMTSNLLVKDKSNQEILDILCRDVELTRDEGNLNAGIGLDQPNQHLGPDVLQDIVDIRPNERVVHDRRPVFSQNLLKLANVPALVGAHKVGHRHNLRVVLVWLSLLRVKGVDLGLHQHVGQYQVLENLDTLETSCLVIVAERLEKVCLRLVPLLLDHMHLASTLTNNSHDTGVRNGRLDRETLLVERLQLLAVLCLCVHLNLERKDLQQMCSLALVIRSIIRLTRRMQLAKNL